MSHVWTDEEKRLLVELTPRRPPVTIAVKVQRSVRSVIAMQVKMGLRDTRRVE